MAPVGCWESLAAAINAGTGSVYFGIGRLNMRAGSSVNFSPDDIESIVARCREAGVKTYLTLNTVVYPEDMTLMREIVDKAKAAGVDAIIASDIAAMQYAVQQDVEVHLSTQLNISNTKALRFYAQFADVVVLARELNLDQVAAIHRDIVEQDIRGRHGGQVRIEMFCHGALCMAVSGKCYMSLHENNTSANRGSCVQVCRHAYTVRDKETGAELDIQNQYIMSPKDLKTIHFLNKILDAGVSVLKIEGRARGPEYVRTVVECYREAVAAYRAGEYAGEGITARIADWDTRLAQVFNRGWWDGYYLGQRLGEWSHTYGSQATRRKVYAGKVTDYFRKNGIAEVHVEACQLRLGDELLFTGATTGVTEHTLTSALFFPPMPDGRATDKPVDTDTADKGFYISFPTAEPLRRGDKVYKWQVNA